MNIVFLGLYHVYNYNFKEMIILYTKKSYFIYHLVSLKMVGILL